MTCTVTTLKNVLWNQPTAASGNYFGRSETVPQLHGTGETQGSSMGFSA